MKQCNLKTSIKITIITFKSIQELLGKLKNRSYINITFTKILSDHNKCRVCSRFLLDELKLLSNSTESFITSPQVIQCDKQAVQKFFQTTSQQPNLLKLFRGVIQLKRITWLKLSFHHCHWSIILLKEMLFKIPYSRVFSDNVNYSGRVGEKSGIHSQYMNCTFIDSQSKHV